MIDKQDVINVYWAPAVFADPKTLFSQEWELLYPEPSTVYSELNNKKINSEGLKTSFFVCPSVKNNFKNTYVFNNVLESEYNYIGRDISPISKNFLSYETDRPQAITSGPLINLGLRYVFFADSDLEAHFTSPYFHKAEYLKYGSLVPGSYNIGSWFRQFNFELQMWENEGNFIVKENEPIFYVNFKTNKKIKLHRFKYTDILNHYAMMCATSPINIKSNIPLVDRYKMFKNARANELILKEIKKNLIGEHYE